jgi:hypothetical protein
MKKRNGLLIIILILISILSFAQDKEICLPEAIVDKIIVGRIDQENLEYTLSIKDSIIHIYEHKDSVATVEIQQLKLSNKDYEVVIKNLREIETIDLAEIKDLKSEAKKKKLKTVVTDVLQYSFIIVLGWLAVKSSIN